MKSLQAHVGPRSAAPDNSRDSEGVPRGDRLCAALVADRGREVEYLQYLRPLVADALELQQVLTLDGSRGRKY